MTGETPDKRAFFQLGREVRDSVIGQGNSEGLEKSGIF